MNEEGGVPLLPVYVIVLTSSGEVMIDGVSIPVLEGYDPRTAAIAEIHKRAALKGRPVRAVAKETTGVSTSLVIDPRGTLRVIEGTHPVPPRAESEEHAWESPMPPHYAMTHDAMRKHEKNGDLGAAIDNAWVLETALSEEFGPNHPHTINVLTTRSWLTLRKQADWALISDLLMETVRRRNLSNAPKRDTAQVVRNSHAAWRKLAAQNKEEAMRRASDLLDLLIEDTDRSTDVRSWIECVNRSR